MAQTKATGHSTMVMTPIHPQTPTASACGWLRERAMEPGSFAELVIHYRRQDGR
jgi:hypothetical protein